MALGGRGGREVSVNLIARDQVSGPLQKITTTADATAGSLERAGSEGAAGMKQVSSAAREAGASLEASAAQAALFGTAITSALAIPIGMGTKAAFAQVDAVEQATIALRVYEQDVSKVNDVLAELLAFARSDPGRLFSRQELFAAAQGLKVMGAETENLSRYVQIMSRSVSIGAGTWDELGQVIGRVGSTGQLTGVEFDNLTKMGFQLDSSLRNTTVTWEQLFDALDKGIGQVEGQTETIRGQVTLTQTALRGLGLAFLDVDADASTFVEGGLGDQLFDGLSRTRDVLTAMQPVARTAGEALAFFAGGAGLVIDAFTSLPDWMQSATIGMVGLTGIVTLGASTMVLAFGRIAAAGTALRATFTALAAHPVGLALAAVGLAIGVGVSLWARHRNEVEKTRAAYDALEGELSNTEQLIRQMMLSGDQAGATMANAMSEAVTASFESLSSTAEANFMKFWEGLQSPPEGHGQYIKNFLDTAIGQQFIDWAKENEALPAETLQAILDGNTAIIEREATTITDAMREYFQSFEVPVELQGQIQKELNDLFELIATPGVDSGAIWDEFWIAFDQFRETGDASAFIAQLDEIEQGALKSVTAMQELERSTQFLIDMADLRLAGNGALATDLMELDTAIQGIGGTSESTGMWLEYLVDQISKENIAAGDLAVKIERLNQLRDAGIISTAQHGVLLENLVIGTVAVAIAEGEAADEAERFAEAITGVSSAARDAASEGIDQYNEKLEQMIDLFGDLFEVAGMSDPLSRWNLSGYGSEWSVLAMNINQASGALDNVFRAIVTNTDALGKQIEGVKSWADTLIGDPGSVALLDEAYARWIQSGMDVTEAQERWNAAQAAQVSITEDNIRAQNAVIDIQLQQSPLIAEQTSLLADQMEMIAGLPAQQQLVTLGWMDNATAAKAMEFQTLAVAAATGQLGEGGEKVFAQMIAGAARLDPVLAAVLEDMGLISVGADGTITVHLSGVDGALSEVQELTVAIVTLADLMDNNELDGSISFEVLGLDDPREKLDDIKDQAVALDGTVTEVGVDVTVNTPSGDPNDPFPPGFLDNMGDALEVTFGADTTQLEATLEDLRREENVIPVSISAVIANAGSSFGSMAAGAFSDVREVVIPVHADTEPLQADIDTIMASFDTTSTVEVSVAADDADATTMVDSWQARDGEIISSLTVHAIGNDESASNMIASYNGREGESLASMNVWAIGNDDSAANMITSYNAREGESLAMMYVWAIGNDASARGMLDFWGIRDQATIATMYIDVITRSRTTGAALGGVINGYADGGVVIRAAENGPEIGRFADGGTALFPRDGLYSVPMGTYVSPNNAVGNSFGGNTFNFYVYGGDAEYIKRVFADEIVPAISAVVDDNYRMMGVM